MIWRTRSFEQSYALPANLPPITSLSFPQPCVLPATRAAGVLRRPTGWRRCPDGCSCARRASRYTHAAPPPISVMPSHHPRRPPRCRSTAGYDLHDTRNVGGHRSTALNQCSISAATGGGYACWRNTRNRRPAAGSTCPSTATSSAGTWVIMNRSPPCSEKT